MISKNTRLLLKYVIECILENKCIYGMLIPLASNYITHLIINNASRTEHDEPDSNIHNNNTKNNSNSNFVPKIV